MAVQTMPREALSWQKCPDPERMLSLLRDRASSRKLRLFAVACCRAVESLIHDPRAFSALAVAERFAEGLVSEAELFEACDSAFGLVRRQGARLAEVAAWRTAYSPRWERVQRVRAGVHLQDAGDPIWDAARDVAYQTALAAAWDVSPAQEWNSQHQSAHEARRAAQADLLRDLFGNPFQPVAIDPTWLAWEGGIVVRLATGLYEEQAFDRLPVLADALEDAGCTDELVLDHCRSSKPHVRGCWLLDAIMGKGDRK